MCLRAAFPGLAAVAAAGGATAAPADHPQHPEFEELYDLEDDVWETRNLADCGEHHARLAELRRHCDEWIRRLSAAGIGAER